MCGSFPSYDFTFDFEKPFLTDYENPTASPTGAPPRYPPAKTTFSIQSRYRGKLFSLSEIEDLR